MSDLPYEEKSIGLHRYRVEALSMTEWERLSEFLSEVLGEPVSSLVKGFDVGDLQALMLGEPDALAQVVSVLSEKITTGRMAMLREIMGHCLFVFDDDDQWNKLSQAKQNDWWARFRTEYAQCVWLFLRVQYAGFFTGFAELMPSKPKKGESQKGNTKPQQNASPSTS